jgi:hypothetical protein
MYVFIVCAHDVCVRCVRRFMVQLVPPDFSIACCQSFAHCNFILNDSLPSNSYSCEDRQMFSTGTWVPWRATLCSNTSPAQTLPSSLVLPLVANLNLFLQRCTHGIRVPARQLCLCVRHSRLQESRSLSYREPPLVGCGRFTINLSNKNLLEYHSGLNTVSLGLYNHGLQRCGVDSCARCYDVFLPQSMVRCPAGMFECTFVASG